jgi:hypothetical protein
MQLFSFEQQKSQPLEAHAAAFSTVKVRCRWGRRRAAALRQPLLAGNRSRGSSGSSSSSTWR